MLMLLIIYTVSKGLEVIARTARRVFYAVIVGISTLFKVKRPSALTYPVGTVILFFSLTIASNFQEHLKEGLTIMPVLLFIPFHVVIPFTLLCIAFIKHRIKKTKALQPS